MKQSSNSSKIYWISHFNINYTQTHCIYKSIENKQIIMVKTFQLCSVITSVLNMDLNIYIYIYA